MNNKHQRKFNDPAEKKRVLRQRSKERRLAKDALGNLRADAQEYQLRKTPGMVGRINQGGAPR